MCCVLLCPGITHAVPGCSLQSTADNAYALQYTSQAAQRYRQQLEKDAAKLSALPKPEALLDAPAPVANPAAPTSTAAPPSTSATAAPLAAAAAPASSNGRAVPGENGAVEKAPAGARFVSSAWRARNVLQMTWPNWVQRGCNMVCLGLSGLCTSSAEA